MAVAVVASLVVMIWRLLGGTEISRTGAATSMGWCLMSPTTDGSSGVAVGVRAHDLDSAPKTVLSAQVVDPPAGIETMTGSGAEAEVATSVRASSTAADAEEAYSRFLLCMWFYLFPSAVPSHVRLIPYSEALLGPR